jgi:BASS family bile acid:Na+ symporter
MAMLIAITFLQTPAYATSAGVYGLTMYIGAGLLVYVAKLAAKKS